MHYIDGFVAAVPRTNKDAYILHAQQSAAVFKEYGALQLVECWGDDVPEGEITSFPKAVKCEDNEAVVFSWITWPSKEIRDKNMAELMKDSRLDPDQNPFPFDGMRMIYGGFEMIVNE